MKTRNLHSLLLLLAFLYTGYANAVIISPWGNAVLKNFDILVPNSGGLDLIVDGGTTFLAAERQGLYILDTSNLDDIKVKYQLTLSDFALSGYSLYSIVKNGNYLYCGFRRTSGTLEGYLKVVNLENVASTGPVVEANDLYFNWRVTGLFLNAETQKLYAALRLGGLALIDVSDASSPTLIGEFYTSSVEHQQVIIDSIHQRAYFGAWFKGIGAVDISDANPTNWSQILVDDTSANDRYWYLAQKDQYLYAPVADSPSDNAFNEGLAVYDLTENFQDADLKPKRVGFAEIPAQYQCESASGGKDEGLVGGDPGPHQIYLSGNFAIVGNGCMGIAIFDISNPVNPLFVKEYEIPGQMDYPWSVARLDNKLITVGRNKNNSLANDVYVFDIEPVTFSFVKQLDVAVNSMILSESVIVSGLGVPVDISIVNGEYSINGNAFTGVAGVINNADTVQIRLISSALNNTKTIASVSIGGVSDDFEVITMGEIISVEEVESGAIPKVINGGGVAYIDLMLLCFLLGYYRYKVNSLVPSSK